MCSDSYLRTWVCNCGTHAELSEVESIFSSVQTACKTISNLVRRSSITGITGMETSGAINVQGEEQKKLDVITNDVLKRALQYTGAFIVHDLGRLAHSRL